jgi:hypothetical protein
MISIERQIENGLATALAGISGVNIYKSDTEGQRLLPNIVIQVSIGSEEVIPYSGVFRCPATITYATRADTTTRSTFDVKFQEILQVMYQSPNLASVLTTDTLKVFLANVSSESPEIRADNRTWAKTLSLDISCTSMFSPENISDLSLWLKADAGVTLSGSSVTAWADQSGNGKNATAIESPIYETNSINGKPALVFANNAYLTTANIFSGANPRSMFAVYYINSENNSDTVIAQSNEDSQDNGTYFMLQSRIDLDSSPYLAGFGDDLSGPSFVNQELLLGMADYDGATARLFKNGTQANSSAKSYNTHNGAFYIGAFNEAGTISEKFDGKIAEIVIYNRVLTTQERQQVEAYLNSKYEIY